MMLTAYRLDDEEIPTALCGVGGCEEPAFMWGSDKLDGYVDTCEGHAAEAVERAVEEQSPHVEGICPLCYRAPHKGRRSYCPGGQE